MGIKIWYLVAVVFIVSANGQLSDNEARYYAQLESSSPAPPTSPPPGREVVLYLTGEQVQSLQAAGAIVKPFPLYEKEFAQEQYQQQEQQEQQRPQYQQQQPQAQYKQQQKKLQYQEQQQYQQNDEEPTEIQYQPNSGNRDAKQEELLDEYYKELNIQQINEDLSVEPQPEEPSTEKPRPKYKYSPKLRQDYSALYVQKKANRGKSSSTEYVRYLPNYEVEELKKEPYRAQPVPGYRFNAPSNYEVQAYYHNEARREAKNQNYGEIRRPEQIQRIENIPIRALVINNEPRQAQQQEAPIKVQSATEDKGPVTFEGKGRQYAKPWAAFRVQAPANTWPSSIWEPAKIQESNENSDRVSTQKYQNVQIPSDGELPQRERVERPKIASQKPESPVDIQRQDSSSLAPLDQHEKIAESIAKEKEQLINNEREIHNKLKQLKDSGNHDEKVYATELDKLNKNLAKQNVLAEKLALVISKKTEVSFENLQSSSNRRESEEIRKQGKKTEPTKVLVSIPRPQESRTTQEPSVPSEVRPVSEQPSENTNIQSPVPTDESKHVPHPAARNVYVKVDNPFIVQKVVPVEVNHEFPAKYPHRQSAELVLRPLWEH